MATNIKTEPISLNCELCSEMFTDPLMLPCLHSFCKKCLIKVADEQGASDGHLKCPTCDTSVSIPSEGITAFPQIFGWDIKLMYKNTCRQWIVRIAFHVIVVLSVCKWFWCSLLLSFNNQCNFSVGSYTYGVVVHPNGEDYASSSGGYIQVFVINGTQTHVTERFYDDYLGARNSEIIIFKNTCNDTMIFL